MAADPEPYFHPAYRKARRAFIAACEAAGLDAIARVHPSLRGPDGKPLFLDSVALGPRGAEKALVLISGRAAATAGLGSAVQTGLLREGLARRAPGHARVVLLHALDPFGFAWNKPNPDPAWPLQMLGAVAAEDLAHARDIRVLELCGPEKKARAERKALELAGGCVRFKALATAKTTPLRGATAMLMAAAMGEIAAL